MEAVVIPASGGTGIILICDVDSAVASRHWGLSTFSRSVMSVEDSARTPRLVVLVS